MVVMQIAGLDHLVLTVRDTGATGPLLPLHVRDPDGNLAEINQQPSWPDPFQWHSGRSNFNSSCNGHGRALNTGPLGFCSACGCVAGLDGAGLGVAGAG